jgi:hypothetical protein
MWLRVREQFTDFKKVYRLLRYKSQIVGLKIDQHCL